MFIEMHPQAIQITKACSSLLKIVLPYLSCFNFRGFDNLRALNISLHDSARDLNISYVKFYGPRKKSLWKLMFELSYISHTGHHDLLCSFEKNC